LNDREDFPIALVSQELVAPAGTEDRYAGVRALWAKVIIRAIFDWICWRDSPRLDKKKVADQAEAWLFEPNEVFNSFDNVCEMLDISPRLVRESARKMSKDHVAKIEHMERDATEAGEDSVEVRLLLVTGSTSSEDDEKEN
jgi:hypothetical protein